MNNFINKILIFYSRHLIIIATFCASLCIIFYLLKNSFTSKNDLLNTRRQYNKINTLSNFKLYSNKSLREDKKVFLIRPENIDLLEVKSELFDGITNDQLFKRNDIIINNLIDKVKISKKN